MSWLYGVLVAPMHSLAVALIIPWRQLEPYLNTIGLRAREMGSRGGFNGRELAVALHNARTAEHPVAEVITDGMTGLKTRRYFLEVLDEEWRRSTRTGRRFSLAMVELDRYAQVNNRLGHLLSDIGSQDFAHFKSLFLKAGTESSAFMGLA